MLFCFHRKLVSLKIVKKVSIDSPGTFFRLYFNFNRELFLKYCFAHFWWSGKRVYFLSFETSSVNIQHKCWKKKRTFFFLEIDVTTTHFMRKFQRFEIFSFISIKKASHKLSYETFPQIRLRFFFKYWTLGTFLCHVPTKKDLSLTHEKYS